MMWLLSLLFQALDSLNLRALKLAGVRSRWLETAGGPIHLLESPVAGDERPRALLFHGLGARAADWTPLAPALRRLFGGWIAPDFPGHGLTPSLASSAGAAELEAAVLEALDAVIEEPVVVVGNSMGGMVAIRYALARPERVRGLILLSPGGAPMDAESLEAFWEGFRFRSHGDALGFLDRLMARPPPLIRHLFAAALRHRMTHPGVVDLIGRFRAEDLLTPADLQALSAPIYLIWGAADRVLPPEQLSFFRAHLPESAEIEAPDGFGHSPWLDDLPRLVRAIRGFVERLR